MFGYGFDFSGSKIFPESIRFWISCLRRLQESVGCPMAWWKLQYLFGSYLGLFELNGSILIRGQSKPFCTRHSKTSDKGWLKFENLLGCWTARTV